MIYTDDYITFSGRDGFKRQLDEDAKDIEELKKQRDWAKIRIKKECLDPKSSKITKEMIQILNTKGKELVNDHRKNIEAFKRLFKESGEDHVGEGDAPGPGIENDASIKP